MEGVPPLCISCSPDVPCLAAGDSGHDWGMEYAVEESLARAERLDLLRGRIVGAASEIQKTLGQIIELSGERINSKNTMTPRIEAFRDAQLDRHLNPEHQDRIARSALRLVQYRNRLDHDVWNTMIPLVGYTEVEVQGQGDAHWTITNLYSIELLETSFAIVAVQLEELYSSASLGNLKGSPKSDEHEGITKEIENAAARPGTPEDSRWKWQTMHRIYLDEESEL